MDHSRLVGTRYKGRPYLVGREKIREFARAIQSTLDLHIDEDAAKALGYAGVVAPPTMINAILIDVVEQLMAASPDLAPLHTAEKVVCSRPVVAGDTILTELLVDQIDDRGEASILRTVCTLTNERDGEVVAVVNSTLFVRREVEA